MYVGVSTITEVKGYGAMGMISYNDGSTAESSTYYEWPIRGCHTGILTAQDPQDSFPDAFVDTDFEP
ncbi:hypothetical protein PM082_004275 [Marasmius tenuissimus]|nr:hypothetical protein PM082_004275 [Marasmius tenuissimus]